MTGAQAVTAQDVAALEVADLSVVFGGLRAVDHLSFRVGQGSIKGIIGPNGAGKTTLFNAMAGVTRPSAGRVLLAGQDVTGHAPHRLAAAGMSRTFQNLQIFRDMTVLENVMLGAHTTLHSGWLRGLAGLTGAEERRAEAVATEQLALLGLAARAGDAAGDLGFADAKLLEIARALASSPRLLLLDEPIAGVPLAEQDRIVELIRKVNASGVTIILVEHNMRVVMKVCADILVLNYGKRLAEGSPELVGRHPDVVQAYLGTEATHA